MSGRMRIGEHLLMRESIDALVLSQTVREAQETGQRLVSTLILRAQIESDEGALALSEQTGFPAALQRHLERRDTAAVDAIPAQLARTWVVVPIGRSHAGDLVVCARDPTPILAAALEHATGKKVKLAVAPAILVEKMVRSIYGAPGRPDTPLPVMPPSLADIGDTDVSETRPLTEPRRARTMSKLLSLDDTGPIPRVPMRNLTTLEITLQEMEQAFSIVAVERIVMSYASQRWDSALLVKIEGEMAIGRRGHGDGLGVIEAITLPLTAPSLISMAVETKRTTAEAPDSPVQRHIASLLGAKRPLAAPIESRGAVRSVLVVGDAYEGVHRDSVVELDRLTDALGAAYDRFARSQTRDF
jgi:hypothetical protein